MPLPKALYKYENAINEQWTDSSFSMFSKCEKKLSLLANNTGKNSDRYMVARTELIRAANNAENINSRIQNKVYVRALIDIAKDGSTSNEISMEQSTLTAILLGEPNLTRLGLLNLVMLFFEKYITYSERGQLSYFSSFLRQQFGQLYEEDRKGLLTKIKQHSDLLLRPDAPNSVVTRAIEQDVELVAVFQELGLANTVTGEFIKLCTRLYYLEKLKALPVGEPHAILSEVTQPAVKRMPIKENELVGHATLSILIDRTTDKISKPWLDTILNIAGDPRVPKSATNYLTWWSQIDEKQIAKVRGWMSKVDLTLFLEVLDESASDDDMRRMYADRKTVIEGLDRSGAIIESRLFLGRRAEFYLKQMKHLKQLPSYKPVKSPNTSMIYLKVGNLHLIEGTHSFSLKIMNEIPSRLPIWDYSRSTVEVADFTGTDFKKMWINQFGSMNGCLEMRHDPQQNWIKSLINELNSVGVDVNENQLVTREKRPDFIRKHGKTIMRRSR